MNNKFDYILSSVGIAWSIQDLQNIVSLILLIISLINILFKAGCSIYNKIKNKKYKEIQTDIETAQNELQDLQNKLNNKEEEK